MKRQHLHKKAKALVLSCGMLLSQAPVFAQTSNEQTAIGAEQTTGDLTSNKNDLISSAIAA